MADNIPPFAIIGLGVTIGACCLATFISISKFIGSKDSWLRIQNEVGDIWVFSLIGSALFFGAGILYFMVKPNQEKIMYFVFVVTFLALGLASSALGVALIHKK